MTARVDRVAGSFFERFPACVRRVRRTYILKDILHDWDDARSRTILTNVSAAP